MSAEKEIIEQNLKTELRFPERQALLKTLWKLRNRAEQEAEVEIRERCHAPVKPQRDRSYSISD